MSYYVWIREMEDGEPIEVGHGPFSLDKAKQFARIGSSYGGPREVTRGASGARVRRYVDGKRIWPVTTKQLTGFEAEEVPKKLDSIDNPDLSVTQVLLTAAGVGALVATVAAMLRGATSGSGVAPQVGPVRLVGGVATGPTGYSIVIGQEEKLWLARALLGEVSEAAGPWENAETQRGGAAVLWALLQLHMLWSNRDGSVPINSLPNFIALIRGYAQPLNPLWSTQGAGKCLEFPSRCSDAIIVRRRRIQAYTWEEIPSRVRDLVNEWSAGRIANLVPGMVDYAAYSFDGAQTNIAGNNFGVLGWRRLVS